MGGGNDHTTPTVEAASSPPTSPLTTSSFKDEMIGKTFEVTRGSGSMDVLFVLKFNEEGSLCITFADGTTKEEWWNPWSWSVNDGGDQETLVVLGGKNRPAMLVRFDRSCSSQWSFQEIESSSQFAGDLATGVERVVHPETTCSLTRMSPIVGSRYHLVGVAHDYDICEMAFRRLPPYDQSLFERVVSPSGPLPMPQPIVFGKKAIHEGITCDLTGESPLTGPRFHKWGEDYDLNESAFAILTPEQQADFVRIDAPKKASPKATFGWPVARSSLAGTPTNSSAAGPTSPLPPPTPPLNPPPASGFFFPPPNPPSGFSFPPPLVAPPPPPLPLDIELIVDRSGSMSSLVGATVAGLNDFLAEQVRAQQKMDHEAAIRGVTAQQARVSLTTFDSHVEQVWSNIPLARFSHQSSFAFGGRLKVTPDLVRPRGQTALYDALGGTLANGLGRRGVYVVVTDGQENASRIFSRAQVAAAIEARKREGWSFVFLAANQDAVATGATLGIEREHACTFGASSAGVTASFGCVASKVAGNRTRGAPLSFAMSDRESCAAGDPTALATLQQQQQPQFGVGGGGSKPAFSFGGSWS